MVSKLAKAKGPTCVQRIVSRALLWKRTSIFPPPINTKVIGRMNGAEDFIYFCVPKWNPDLNGTITHWMVWNDENEEKLFKALEGEEAS